MPILLPSKHIYIEKNARQILYKKSFSSETKELKNVRTIREKVK